MIKSKWEELQETLQVQRLMQKMDPLSSRDADIKILRVH